MPPQRRHLKVQAELGEKTHSDSVPPQRHKQGRHTRSSKQQTQQSKPALRAPTPLSLGHALARYVTILQISKLQIQATAQRQVLQPGLTSQHACDNTAKQTPLAATQRPFLQNRTRHRGLLSLCSPGSVVESSQPTRQLLAATRPAAGDVWKLTHQGNRQAPSQSCMHCCKAQPIPQATAHKRSLPLLFAQQTEHCR